MSPDPYNSAASAPNAVLGGAALAVGALLAGVAIGRRSRWGLAFGLGVAAVAGYQLIKQRRQLEDKPALPPVGKAAEPSAAVVPPQEAASPAVVTEMPALAPLMPEEKIAVAAEAPAAVAAFLPDAPKEVQPFPPAPMVVNELSAPAFAPLIWEGGDSGSRSSDGMGETVWFGLQDVAVILEAALPPPAPSGVDAPQSPSLGEVAMEGDLAPLVASFVADFPPAPQLDTVVPSISPDVAALIQALNPPPLSSGLFAGQTSYLGPGGHVEPISYEDDENGTEDPPESFLLEDTEPGQSTPKGSSLAAVALVLLSVLGLSVGWMKASPPGMEGVVRVIKSPLHLAE